MFRSARRSVPHDELHTAGLHQVIKVTFVSGSVCNFINSSSGLQSRDKCAWQNLLLIGVRLWYPYSGLS